MVGEIFFAKHCQIRQCFEKRLTDLTRSIHNNNERCHELSTQNHGAAEFNWLISIFPSFRISRKRSSSSPTYSTIHPNIVRTRLRSRAKSHLLFRSRSIANNFRVNSAHQVREGSPINPFAFPLTKFASALRSERIHYCISFLIYVNSV